MNEVPVSSKVVRGTRVSWFRQLRDAELMQLLFAWASPLWIIIIATKLVFFRSEFSFSTVVLYAFAVMMACIGIGQLVITRRDAPIDCECPACGVPSSFDLSNDKSEPPIARCHTCLAYVTRRGDEISEVPLDTTISSGFSVYDYQYKRSVHPDENGRIVFAMPAFCAICGSAATDKRDIPVDHLLRTARKDAPPDRISSLGFQDMQVPVCATHLDTPIDPMTVSDWAHDIRLVSLL